MPHFAPRAKEPFGVVWSQFVFMASASDLSCRVPSSLPSDFPLLSLLLHSRLVSLSLGVPLATPSTSSSPHPSLASTQAVVVGVRLTLNLLPPLRLAAPCLRCSHRCPRVFITATLLKERSRPSTSNSQRALSAGASERVSPHFIDRRSSSVGCVYPRPIYS